MSINDRHHIYLYTLKYSVTAAFLVETCLLGPMYTWLSDSVICSLKILQCKCLIKGLLCSKGRICNCAILFTNKRQHTLIETTHTKLSHENRSSLSLQNDWLALLISTDSRRCCHTRWAQTLSWSRQWHRYPSYSWRIWSSYWCQLSTGRNWTAISRRTNARSRNCNCSPQLTLVTQSGKAVVT